MLPKCYRRSQIAASSLNSVTSHIPLLHRKNSYHGSADYGVLESLPPPTKAHGCGIFLSPLDNYLVR